MTIFETLSELVPCEIYYRYFIDLISQHITMSNP